MTLIENSLLPQHFKLMMLITLPHFCLKSNCYISCMFFARSYLRWLFNLAASLLYWSKISASCIIASTILSCVLLRCFFASLLQVFFFRRVRKIRLHTFWLFIFCIAWYNRFFRLRFYNNNFIWYKSWFGSSILPIWL